MARYEHVLYRSPLENENPVYCSGTWKTPSSDFVLFYGDGEDSKSVLILLIIPFNLLIRDLHIGVSFSRMQHSPSLNPSLILVVKRPLAVIKKTFWTKRIGRQESSTPKISQ